MPQSTHTNALSALSRRLEEMVGAAGNAVVGVRVQGSHVASGFLWRPGTVVTASDAVEAGEDLSVTAGAGPLAAQLAGRDPATGIAVLRVADAPPQGLEMSVRDSVGVGQMVLALARNGEGIGACLGMVSAAGGAWQSRRGGRIDRLIRLDMRLAPQGEGGIVVDGDGAFLGMALLGPRRRPLVIPAATLERVAPRLLADGRIPRGYLGVGLHPIRLDEALAAVHALPDRRASIVVSLDPDGPARKGGVLVGDVIVGLNGEAVAGMRSLLAKLTSESVGSVAELKLLRAGQIVAAKVAIAARPSA
jgi:S1-C subfamily serine protease